MASGRERSHLKRAARPSSPREDPGDLEALEAKLLKAMNTRLRPMEEAIQALTAAMQTVKEELQADFKATIQQEFATFKEESLQEISRLRSEVEAQQNTVAQLQKALEDRERQDKSANLVIYGVLEEDEHSAEDKVNSLFPPSSTRDPVPIQEARRLGEPREARGATAARPRPILVRFKTVAAKHAALKYAKELRAHKVFLDADLTTTQREARRLKQDRFQELKSHGVKPFWRCERLFFYKDGVASEDGVNTGPSPPARE